ncbi:CoA transferase, partial [Streptomyces sp. SID685]|nr:CoA transferase [Streptomyces sp. SID685]
EFWALLGVPSALAGRGWLPFQQRFATAVCPLPEQLRAAARRRTLPDLAAAAYDSGVSLLTLGADPAPAVHPEPWRLTPAPAVHPEHRQPAP